MSIKQNKELSIKSVVWLLKSKPSDEDTTSVNQLCLVFESKTTEQQDVLTKSKGETRSQIDEMSLLMPEYLKGLFDAIKGPLESHVHAVGELLLEFRDIFAQHDLGLGCLSVMKHRIVTGKVKQVKQRMRRSSLSYKNDEHKHLDKILAAGLIQPHEFD